MFRSFPVSSQVQNFLEHFPCTFRSLSISSIVAGKHVKMKNFYTRQGNAATFNHRSGKKMSANNSSVVMSAFEASVEWKENSSRKFVEKPRAWEDFKYLRKGWIINFNFYGIFSFKLLDSTGLLMRPLILQERIYKISSSNDFLIIFSEWDLPSRQWLALTSILLIAAACSVAVPLALSVTAGK